MSRFIGKVRADASWAGLTRAIIPTTGYIGRAFPGSKKHSSRIAGEIVSANPGEVIRKRIGREVARQWVKSLKAEGRHPTITEDEDGWITVEG